MSSSSPPSPYPKKDYSGIRVTELKGLCRQRELRVSGAKSMLVGRLTDFDDDEVSRAETARAEAEAETSASVSGSGRGSRGGAAHITNDHALADADYSSDMDRLYSHVPSPLSDHLADLVEEYLRASGGTAGSRDVGRYLSANAAFASAPTISSSSLSGGAGIDSDGHGRRQRPHGTALSELKESYGNFANFLICRRDKFVKMKEESTTEGRSYGFPVRLR